MRVQIVRKVQCTRTFDQALLWRTIRQLMVRNFTCTHTRHIFILQLSQREVCACRLYARHVPGLCLARHTQAIGVGFGDIRSKACAIECQVALVLLYLIDECSLLVGE